MIRRFPIPQWAGIVLLAWSAAATATASEVPTAAEEAVDRELTAFEEALDRAMAESGPYHPALAETYQSMGHHLQQQGRHGDALPLFRKAQHLQRVNHGIHHASQLPALRAMIASQQATGQFEAASASYDQLLWVGSKALAAEDPQRIELLRSAARWRLSAHLLDDDDHRYDHLQTAHQLLVQAIGLADQFEPGTAVRVDLLRDLGTTQFYLLRLQELQRFDPARAAGYRTPANATPVGAPGLTASFVTGRKLYETALTELTTNPQASEQWVQRAHIELADWHLMFGHQADALAQYRAVLNQHETPEDPFARPLALPAARGDATSALVAKIRLDVSAQGRPDNVELLELPEGTEPNRILRIVRDARFRPAFVAGEPVDSIGTTLDFPLAD